VDPTSLLTLFLSEGPRWVHAQRTQHRSAGRTLTPEENRTFAPFFDQPILDKARFVTVPAIPNPPFYAPLVAQGIPIPLDFSQTSGITFDDTVLLSASRPVEPAQALALLFHELVHVVQFDVAGIDGFVSRYVQGWAQNGFAYERIPLEVQAYGLDARFSASPSQPFSVRTEVAALMGSKQ
jgi:hypothetical protein